MLAARSHTWGGERRQEEVRGLLAEGAKLWAAGRGEDAVVRWLLEGARGGGERRREEVRGLRLEGGNHPTAIGCEAALVQRLRSEGGPRRLGAVTPRPTSRKHAIEAGGSPKKEAEGDRPSSNHL